MSEEVAAANEAIGLVGRIVGYITHCIGKQIRIKSIKSNHDPDIHQTLELYEKLFKEEHKVYPSELTAWLRTKHKTTTNKDKINHCLLIAKRRGKVVALLKALYCPESRWAFIAYFGVDKGDVEARKVASKIILRLFKKYLYRNWKCCQGIAFELEPLLKNASKEQKFECNARRRLFRDLALSQGHHAFEVKIEYYQPIMASNSNYHGIGRKLCLMVIPTSEIESHQMTRADVEILLKYIYYDIYGKNQDIPMNRSNHYINHLNSVYNRVSESLDAFVELEA